MLISIEKRAPADLADLRRFSTEIICNFLFPSCLLRGTLWNIGIYKLARSYFFEAGYIKLNKLYGKKNHFPSEKLKAYTKPLF
ncbi:MAG TPA: hypothetical protein DCQ58_03555 [Saprospirales bacterium]|nr:hypothetical protein [Saprospirales bacterium]